MEPALIVYSTTTLSTALLSQALHRSLTLARIPAHPPLRVDSLPADALPLLAPNQPVVFLLSTTGAGEPNADLKLLWQLLMREGLPADLLETARFAVLGCGDSGYERFNWVGKIWRRRMLALGAEEIATREGSGGEEGWWADERSPGGSVGTGASNRHGHRTDGPRILTPPQARGDG
jgi:sulfite reductase alpha subunit-like flavoprotein